MALGCADRFLKGSMRDDELDTNEHLCVVSCLNKYYRYLAYANTLYSFLLKEEEEEEDDHPTRPPHLMY